MNEVNSVERPVRRLTKLQRALMAHISERGGAHVYLSPCTRANGHLSGYTWEGVNLSLQSLLRAGLIQKSGRNDSFWSLTPNAEFSRPQQAMTK